MCVQGRCGGYDIGEGMVIKRGGEVGGEEIAELTLVAKPSQ